MNDNNQQAYDYRIGTGTDHEGASEELLTRLLDISENYEVINITHVIDDAQTFRHIVTAWIRRIE